MKKKTHEEYVAELAVKNPTVEVVEKYITEKTKIKHYCSIHNIYWDAMPSNILRGKGCRLCQKEKHHKSTAKTSDKYIEELKQINPNLIIMENYIDSKTPILHKCLIDNYEWNARPGNILSGRGCPKCAKEIRINHTTKNHHQYITEVLDVNSNIEVLEEYIGMNVPILHRCKIHDIKWKAIPTSILRGSGCYKCGREKSIKSKRKTHLQYTEELKQINPNIEVVDQYINDSTLILHRCLIDRNKWMAKPNNILNGCGCPKCNESKGERKVRLWLEKNNIPYEYQYAFDDCYDINPLPFDFYIHSKNMCIEYDGKQHFEPVEYFGGEEKFKIQQKHDNTKNEYCKKNGISLLRIPYFKNIEEELNNFLFI